MTRYIDADALKELWQPDHNRKFEADYFIHTIDNAPTADVVEVVRCKDCKYRDPEDERCDHGAVNFLLRRTEKDYCSYGERKGGDE